MKTIKINFERECGYKHIVPISDLHLGDYDCDLNMLKELLEVHGEDENSLFILNGDLMNNATKTSVSDVYSQTITPMRQLEILVELFMPYRNKIIAILGGNHERRTYREDGIDLSKILARELGLEDRYSEDGALIFLRFGELNKKETNGSGNNRQICYTIYVTHGSGGGRSAGSKINALEQLCGIVDADVYIHSHTHLPASFKQNFFRTDVRNSSVQEVTKLFVNTNAFLNYGGYGEIAKYKPACKETPVICLDGTQKYTCVTI